MIHILVRLPNWLGDMVMSTAFLRALQQAHPGATIDVIAKKGIDAVAEYVPGIRTVHVFSKEEWPGLKGAWRFGKKMERFFPYDMMYVLPESFSSAVMAYATGAPVRIGFGKELRSFLLTRAENKPRGLHRVEEYMHLLPPESRIHAATPTVYLENRSLVDHRRIIINVNSEADSRRLPVEKAVAIINKLRAATDHELVLMGSPKELPHVQAVYDRLEDRHRVSNMAGKTNLHGLIALLGSAPVMLTTDSGPMHLANALGVHTVALEGASDERNTAPYNATRRTLIRSGKLPCEPCVKNTCRFGVPKCLMNMEDDLIVQAVLRAAASV